MHMPHLRELDDLYALVGLADVSPEVLELVGEHYGVEPRHRHRSLSDLLAGPIDAVLILTPGSHGRTCAHTARSWPSSAPRSGSGSPSRRRSCATCRPSCSTSAPTTARPPRRGRS